MLDRMVLVEWEDATQPIPDWISAADIDDKPTICKTVGWLVRKANGNIVLAMGQTDDHLNGVATIPTSAIRRMVELRLDE
jgi:hypothetical protein